MKNRLPQRTQTLRKTYPGVWKSFQDLGEQCPRAGPLEERARRLVKVGISAAA
jgi:alkylhydroperoxidase/carboxymuconolactone decarboxylase family protein YurZ